MWGVFRGIFKPPSPFRLLLKNSCSGTGNHGENAPGVIKLVILIVAMLLLAQETTGRTPLSPSPTRFSQGRPGHSHTCDIISSNVMPSQMMHTMFVGIGQRSTA